MNVSSKKGMVATSQYLATKAGTKILRLGGNAIDAAIATAAALTVVEPTSNGIGGDAFAIVAFEGKLYALNASGKSPKAISREKLIQKGIHEIPRFGFLPVTVPGIPSAWAALHQKFGKLPFEVCLEPAITYARDGFEVSDIVAKNWRNAARIYHKYLSGEQYQEWFDTFTIQKEAPKAGSVFYLPNHAKTLHEIAQTKSESFYRGALANKIVEASKRFGGYFEKEDLEKHEVVWSDPISISYKGYEVHECPPNGQGLVALEALKIIEGFDLTGKTREEILHLQIEAIKSAFADGKKHIADQLHMEFSAKDFLQDDYISLRRSLIQETAVLPSYGTPPKGGTVYLTTADEEGNMVSYIQSNYMGFGSGIVVPGTGIALQNRGHNFSMEKDHVNVLEGGKRPYHTIIPAFLTKNGIPLGPIGVMGGFMQPQGHLQVVMNLIDFHMTPYEALLAPRFQWMDGFTVAVEQEMPKEYVDYLSKIGHHMQIYEDNTSFGRGEIILRQKDGSYLGASEPRCDSLCEGIE